MYNKPNTFIVGASKCGTTTLSAWLSEHPSVFMSVPKEPGFFLKSNHASKIIKSLEKYSSLFANAKDQHRIVAEASPGYILDDEAIPALIAYSPEARLIVMLRHPVERVQSCYGQNIRELRETHNTLEEAWESDKKRAAGSCETGYDSEEPNYHLAGALGSRLAYVYRYVARDKVHVIFLEDIKSDPKNEWEKLLEFLEIEDDGRTRFPSYNVGRQPKRVWLYRKIAPILNKIKRISGCQFNTGIVLKMVGEKSSLSEKEKISDELRKEMLGFFESETQIVERLTGRKLPHWRE